MWWPPVIKSAVILLYLSRVHGMSLVLIRAEPPCEHNRYGWLSVCKSPFMSCTVASLVFLLLCFSMEVLINAAFY